MRIVKNSEIQAILMTISATINQISAQSHFPCCKSLESWYDGIICHCNDTNDTNWPSPKTMDKDCVVRPIQGATYGGLNNYGFDIPLWLKNNNYIEDKEIFSSSAQEERISDLVEIDSNSIFCDLHPEHCFEKIMIVAQDPLRKEGKQDLTMSSPFGLHFKPYRINSQKGFLTPIISGLFTAGVKEIYITDAYKLYVEGGIRKMRSNKEVFSAILQTEIEQFNPNVIVTFSVRSRKLLRSVLHLKNKLHRSTSNKYAYEYTNANNNKITIYHYPYPRPLYGALIPACKVVSDILSLNTEKIEKK